MITLEDRAAELYEVIRGCTLCALASTRTQAVPGEGPLTAEVMCIGEAPGLNEDRQGRPFVGAAGKFLDELLAAGGLRRDEVYICNVLKCRPPGNRDPLPGEIEACAEYLDLQIDMVDPLVIVTLGRFSMSRWFPQQAISRIHGSVREFDGRFVIPMYHPAAALHQQNLRQVLIEDFQRLPQVIARARALRSSPASATGGQSPVEAAPAAPKAPPEYGESIARPTAPQGAQPEQIRLFE
jgi:DNA polymerase